MVDPKTGCWTVPFMVDSTWEDLMFENEQEVQEAKDESVVRMLDVDSINMWPALWSNASKPRQEIHISPVTLISYGGKFKLLTGPDPGNINSHTTPGYVPMAEYAVGCALVRPFYACACPTPFYALCPVYLAFTCD